MSEEPRGPEDGFRGDLPPAMGPWRLLAPLGRGGMSTVHVAEATADAPVPAGTRVALKILDPETARGSPLVVARFLREAELGRQLRHPALARVLESGTVGADGDSRHYMVQELVEGESLRALLDRMRALPEPLVRSLARGVAEALAALHAAGVVHRDVKPENVLITPRHEVKLVDLGVASVAGHSERLTMFGRFVGSPAHAAPEQFEGGEIGPAADLYSLGVLVTEAISGTNPYSAPTFAETMARHLTAAAPALSELEAGASPFLDRLVARMLEKDPERRLADAALLASILREGERSSWWAEQGAEAAGEGPASAVRRRIAVDRSLPVHARADALRALEEAWSAVAAGQGRIVLVAGEEGIGKTRLVDAFVGGTREGARALYGGYDNDEVSSGAEPIGEALSAHFGSRLASEAARRLGISWPFAKALAARLGGESPQGAGAGEMRGLHDLVRRLAQSLAGEGPLVWITEDLHAADPSALPMLVALARAAATSRILLVLTTRDADTLAVEAVSAVGRWLHVPLRRWTRDDMAALISERWPAAAPRAARVLHDASDGNPRVATEILRDAEERGLLDGRELPADVGLPRGLRAALTARLGALDQAERELLEAASVLGAAVDPLLLADALERPRLGVLQALSRIARRTAIVVADGAAFRFDHPLLARILRDSLPQALAIDYHRRMAAARQRELASGTPGARPSGENAVFLSSHFAHAGDAAAALAASSEALAHLLARCESEEALELSGRLLDLAPQEAAAARFDLLLARAAFFNLLGRRREQRAALEVALDVARRAGDSQRFDRGAYRLAIVATIEARIDEARALLASIGGGGDPGVRLDAQLAMAMVDLQEGSVEAAAARVEPVLEEAMRTGDLRRQASALRILGTIDGRTSRYREALERFGALAAACRTLQDREGEATALTNEATVLLHLGLHERAFNLLTEARAACRDIGDRDGEAVVANNIGVVLMNLGRLGAARAPLLDSLRLAREADSVDAEIRAVSNLGLLALHEGRHEEAGRWIDLAMGAAVEKSMPRAESYAWEQRAQLLRAQDRLDEAATAARRCLEIRERLGEPELIAEALVELGRIAVVRGDRDAARGAFVPAREALEGLEHAEISGVVDAHLALLGITAAAAAWPPDAIPMPLRAEAFVVLHEASGDATHRAEATRLLTLLCSHLDPEEADAFWRCVPTARRHAERGGRG